MRHRMGGMWALNLFQNFANLIGNSSSLLRFPQGEQRITINARSDGLSLSGLPQFIAPQVADYPTGLRCCDGTDLDAQVINTLITGKSSYRGEIISRQLICAVKHGFTPIILSSKGRAGEAYQILRTIYTEEAIHFISDSEDSGIYSPFAGMPEAEIVEFYHKLAMAFQPQPVNQMLVRGYISVCVKIFSISPSAVGRMVSGQFDHMGLLEEIHELQLRGRLSNQESERLQSVADSARSVSVYVLGVIQDYLYKVQHSSARGSTVSYQTGGPQITILRNNGRSVLTANDRRKWNAAGLKRRESIFVSLKNYLPGVPSDAASAQCFQWYMSKTLLTEFESMSNEQAVRLLIVVENLGSLPLQWFSWLFDITNSVILFCYEDFYSKLSDAPGLRQQFMGRMNQIFFFSLMDYESAEWASSLFGTHFVAKDVVTDHPPSSLIEIFLPKKSVAHDQERRPWYDPVEIQRLGDSGIVYCQDRHVFKPLYCENGNLYIDRNCRGQKVNFCMFTFS